MNRLPIAFIADKNFFLPTVVAITSLLENKAESSIYIIYVVCVEFTDEQISIFKEIERKYHTKIQITGVNEGELNQKYANLVKHDCNATVSALIKFDLPDICKEEKTLLYLDGDIIVKKDLSFFLDIDLGTDVYVAAVRDSGLLYSKRLIRQNNKDYFNSGVMYLNLDAMRKDGMSQKLIEAKMCATDNSLMDQHVLNEVFGNKKILIDYKYNTLYVNLRRAHFFHKLTLEAVNVFCQQNYSNWEDIMEQAVIVHYSSFDKPWKYMDANGVELWDEYFRKSCVGKENISRKKLHTSQIEAMMENDMLRPLGILAWELETKGVRKCIREIVQGRK